MGQRDIGSPGTYIDPSKDPVPAGFGGQGAPAALPTTIPTGPPAGFKGLSLSDNQKRVMPEPPPGYMPGPTSPARQDYEDSPLFKAFNMLSAAGTGVPASLRIKAAQAEYDAKTSATKLAWDNYYKNNETTRIAMEKQNRDAGLEFLNMLPNVKSFISNIAPEDNEARTALVERFATIGESLTPGGGETVRHIAANLSNVYAMDAFLTHPDQKVSGPFQDMTNRLGYENAIKTKEWMQYSESALFDWTNALAGSLTFDTQTALSKQNGSISELEFKKHMKQRALETGMRPVQMQAIMSYLDAPGGQNLMLQSGVRLASTDMAVAKKGPSSGNPMNAEKLKRFKLNELQIANAAALDLSTEEVQALKDENDTLLRIKSPESSPAQNPGSVAGMTMFDLSKGQYKTAEDMLKKTKDGTPERAQGLAWAHQANLSQQNASAQAQLAKQMGTPVDMSKVDMYSRKDIRNGKVSKLSVPMDEAQKRTNPDMIELDPKIVASLTKLKIAKEQGNTEMYDLAGKSFTATTPSGLSAQWANWKALDIGGPAASLVASNPKNANLVAYHDTFTAWAGKDARALGDEVGTMTDADRLVWKDTFPKPVDTPAIQKQKRAIFNRMIDLIYDINARVATGEDPSIVMSDKKVVDRKNGIFGSARALENKPIEQPEAKSLAEPSHAEASTGTRGESLLEKMRKGTP